MTDLKPLRESSRDAFATELLDSAFLDEPPRHALRRTALWLGAGEAAAATLAASSALGAAPAGALATKAASGSTAALAELHAITSAFTPCCTRWSRHSRAYSRTSPICLGP